MSQPDPSFQRLLSCLEEIRSKLDNKKDDFLFLSNYFHSQEFQGLFKVHNTVSVKELNRSDVVNVTANELALEVLQCMQQIPEADSDIGELMQLISNPHFKGLLLTHDRVAAREYPQRVQQTSNDEPTTALEGDARIPDFTGSPVKFVRLIKSGKDPLGATVRCDDNTGDIIVARILHGGVVDRSGTLAVGDVILEVNNQSVTGKTTNEVVGIMDKMFGSVLFKIIPAKSVDKKSHSESKIRLRVLFNYEPENDDLIPCKEAGLPLSKGDILQVVSREDPNWWQARKDDDTNNNIGLVPSKQFQEKRFLFDKLFAETESHKQKNGALNPVKNFKWRKRKRKESKIADTKNDEAAESKKAALTYEEVTLYSPTDNKQRLVVLIGPSGVGRNELKKRLLASDYDRFVTAVPHTSRRMRPYETDGREYYFVSRTTMQNYAENNKFIEFGEYRKCMYGTSIDSIKRVLKTGKMCVLKIQPAAIKVLRRKEYKPYLVYVKPPSLETLRSTRLTMKSKSDKKRGMRTFKDDDLQDMIEAGEALEQEYGHLFDLTIVNADLQEAFTQLSHALDKVASQSIWVPVEWTR